MIAARNPSRVAQAPAVQAAGRNAGVLQRQCACGQHTGGGKCFACEGKPQSLKDVAQGGLSGAGGALPYLDRIQNSFGRHHDLTRVRAHADGKAAEAAARIGARAYASGDRIAFAGAPSLHTAAHEAAHVIQQRAGVRPEGGVGHVGDPYERHADAVANRVVQRQSSEELLAPYAATRSGSGAADAVQLSAQNTFYGKLTDTKFQKIDGAVGSLRGLHLQISFEPGVAVDATKIAMVQSVRRASEGKATINDPAQQNRVIAQGPAEGYRIDRATATANNPVFGADPLPAGKGLTDTPNTNAPAGTDPREIATYQIGFRYFDNKILKKQDAFLDDTATWNARKSVSMNFETTAVAIEGKQAGTYYGSVKWGWEFDANGELKALDFAKVSDGTPSQNFLAPAAKWNASTARGTLVTRNAPTQVYGHRGDILFPSFTLSQNTTVTTTLSFISGADTYLWATAADGPLIGKQGYINIADMTDKGDGPPTADLPVPAASQGKPDASTFARNGITEVAGQDPESLMRLDTVTAVVYGTNDADTMAMLTEMSDLARELGAKRQRVGFRVFSVNLDAAGNEKTAERINKDAGKQGGPQLCIYVERSKEKVFQGYKAGVDYKGAIRKIIGNASTPGAVKGLIWGATFGAIAGGIAGAIIGGVIGAKTGNAAGGSALGGLLGGALGSAAGVGIGAAIGHIAGDDIGRDPASADDVKKIQAFRDGKVPERDLDHGLSAKVVDYWLDNPTDGALAIFQRQMLIKNLMAGYTGDPEERAILKIIENSSDQDLLQIFALSDANAPNMLDLEDEFQGSEKEYLHKLLDRLRDRFPVDAPLQKTAGLLIDNSYVRVKMADAFEATHPKPGEPLVARECGGVFLLKDGRMEHRGACEVGTDSDVGKIAQDALKEFGKGYSIVGSYHTHPLTVPPQRGANTLPTYPKAAREAPSGEDFKVVREGFGRGKEHYVISQYVTYLITRDGGFRVLGNTADLLKVKRFTPPADQKSTLELG